MYRCIRQTLTHVKDFKKFWKQRGPFEFALTSAEFPPIMLTSEEWIFSNDKVYLIKELMQFEQRKMSFVKTNPRFADSKSFTPDDMIPWKINHFPHEWNGMDCSAFLPQGYLTKEVLLEACSIENDCEIEPSQILESQVIEKQSLIETAFFHLVSKNFLQMGYLLLSPEKNKDVGSLGKYLREWEKDEQDAGILKSRLT